METKIKYSVKTLRAAGLEAKWSKLRSGAPIIICRNPSAKLEHQRKTWWHIDAKLWAQMGKLGIVEAFDNITLLGDIFSLPVA